MRYHAMPNFKPRGRYSGEKYGFLRRQTKAYSRWLSGAAVLLIAAGGYLVLLLFSPHIAAPGNHAWRSQSPVAEANESRLYIPKIKLAVDYATGGPEVLNDKAWQRYPERGDPVRGGNFILSAHRFEIGLTPGETARRSPFYRVGELRIGDMMYVDFEGKRYAYKIEQRYSVAPTEVSIEASSSDPLLTLYTCTLGGSADGREVIRAKVIEKNRDPAKPLSV